MYDILPLQIRDLSIVPAPQVAYGSKLGTVGTKSRCWVLRLEAAGIALRRGAAPETWSSTALLDKAKLARDETTLSGVTLVVDIRGSVARASSD